MREDWNKFFMDITLKVASRSTCARIKVGALLVKDKRIISIGYNGVASKKEHCDDYFENLYINKYMNKYETYNDFLKSNEFYDLHAKFSINNEIHAEMNSILFSARNGVSTEGTDLYVSYSPCIHCAKSILQAGIKNVYYHEKYDRDSSGISFLINNSVECIKI